MFKSLKGLLAGIVAGTALGVLFSPKKGSEIRKDFKKEIKSGGLGLNTAKSTITNLSKDLGHTCMENYEKIPDERKAQAQNIFKKARQKAKKVFHDVKGKIAGK